MKATLTAGEAAKAVSQSRSLVEVDLKKIDAELTHVNKLCMQVDAPDDLKKRAQEKAKALQTAFKAASIIRQRLMEMSRQLAAVPPECEIELSAAEMALFAYGENT